ncbi:MAG: thioesterase family protein [Gammaproteobacteria bacterium]|nr:thioesterase family protein [Gammaproteobacteria bacterium]MDD9894308.1 thioesterase family protein [Gammaproteobacteria bacterium]MDD9958139.1 thioesterase family protein [Gammaproteobacteria bacterium]
MQLSDLKTILTRLEASEENITEFDESWSQGRSAYGGIATAFAVTGMRKMLSTPKPLRSLMVSFIAPVPPGKVKVDARIQREGKNVTQMEGNVICGGQLCLQAMAAFGNPREGLKVVRDRDFKPSPRESGVEFQDHKKRVPGFLQFFEGAWVDGGLPFGGKPSNELNLWIRHKSDMSGLEAEKIVTICDIPPPVILSYFDKGPIPSSSLTWSLEFVVPPSEVKTDWFYLEFEVDAAADGYTQQSGKIYDETGQLCALSRQCMVYFG